LGSDRSVLTLTSDSYLLGDPCDSPCADPLATSVDRRRWRVQSHSTRNHTPCSEWRGGWCWRFALSPAHHVSCTTRIRPELCSWEHRHGHVAGTGHHPTAVEAV